VGFRDFAQAHAEMPGSCRARDWAAAERQRQALEDQARDFGLTKLFGIYRDRIADFSANDPGPEWDGVYSSTEK
jgi:adenylate cyclase